MEFGDICALVAAVFASFASVMSTVIGVATRRWMDKSSARERETKIEIADLRDEVKIHAERRIKNIETRIDKHESADRSAEIITKLASLASLSERMNNKLDRFAEETARQGAEIGRNTGHIKDVHTELKRHKEISHHA